MKEFSPIDIFEIIMEKTVESLKGRVPYDTRDAKKYMIDEKEQIRADIDIVGDKECSLIISGNKELFSKMAYKIHSIDLDDEILPSFVGEFWNFVLGPVIKHIKQYGFSVDISPSRPMPDEIFEESLSNINRYFSIFDLEKGDYMGEIAIYCVSK